MPGSPHAEVAAELGPVVESDEQVLAARPHLVDDTAIEDRRGLGLRDAAEKPALKARILAAGNLLGILGQEPSAWMQGGVDDAGISVEQVEALIEERKQAKLDKNYARADEIREELSALGIVLEDSREGTKWRRG
mgnify:CR=1 FL=1